MVVDEQIGTFKKVIDKLKEYEEEGRRLASQRDVSNKVSETSEYSEKVRVTIMVLKDKLRELMHRADIPLNIRERLNKLWNFLLVLGREYTHLDTVATDCKIKDIDKPKDCEVDPYIQDRAKFLDRTYEQFVGDGKRCTWLLGEVDRYTLSAFTNDLTACLHRLIEKLDRTYGEMTKEHKEITERYALKKNVTRRVEDYIKRWAKKVEELYGEDLYSEEDYRSLYAVGEDDKAELKVGSAAGHRTHVDFKRNTLEYYDKDEDVNQVMKALFEQVGCKCELRVDGVSCKCEDVSKTADVLPYATSMDYRIDEPQWYWDREIALKCAHVKKPLDEKCRIDVFEGKGYRTSPLTVKSKGKWLV